MNRKLSTIRNIMLTAALLASVSGLARADDNSLNPYAGNSYAAFNDGNLSQGGNPVIDQAPSTFHATHPHGLPFSYYTGLASPAPELHPAPAVDKTPSTFRATNPHGLPFSDYAAMSESNAPEVKPVPVIDKTPSTFRATNPHGLPFSFYAAYSDH